MAVKKQATEPFKLGDRVKIRHSDWCARIVELWGPLGPGGTNVYRVRVQHKPKPTYIDLREDQLILIPAKATEPLKVGDRVRIRYSGWRGPIVELLGPVGPDGIQMYRIRIQREPKPKYIEVQENHLIRLRAEP